MRSFGSTKRPSCYKLASEFRDTAALGETGCLPSRPLAASAPNPTIRDTGISRRVRREAACVERAYWGHTRLLGVYELALPGSVLIAVISLPLGETNISKFGRPIPT